MRYTIDAAASRFTVKAYAGGFLSALAHNPTIAIRDFSGEATINLGALEQSSLVVKIDAGSLNVVADVPEKDRPEVERTMHKEVLESDRFADIIYECGKMSVNKTGDNLYFAWLNGVLSLHGVSRAQVLPAQVTLDDGVLKASGMFNVRQSDYRIKLVSAAGGTIKVKDELRLNFAIVARKQD